MTHFLSNDTVFSVVPQGKMQFFMNNDLICSRIVENAQKMLAFTDRSSKNKF